MTAVLDNLHSAAADLDLLQGSAREVEALRMSANTRRAYESDWRAFQRWCEMHDLCPMPADANTVRLYLVDLSMQRKADGAYRLKASSIERALAAISALHKASGVHDRMAHEPLVVGVMAGIRRQRSEQPSQKLPLLLEDVKAVAPLAHGWPAGVSAVRDSFLIWFAFATALRRSEVAGVTAGQVLRHPADGLHIRLGATKTDQEGRGALLAVPYGSSPETCVPCRWHRWVSMLSAAGDEAGVFEQVLRKPTGHVCRGKVPALDPSQSLAVAVNKSGGIYPDRPLSGSGLNDVIKRRLETAGYDTAAYGFHSLRSGFVTQARRNGADTRSVRRQTRHRSDAMVDVYDRDFLPLVDNAVSKLGL